MVTDLLLLLPAFMCLTAALASAVLAVLSENSAIAWIAHVLFLLLLGAYVWLLSRLRKARTHRSE